MTDRFRYDDVPYTSYSYSATDPDRLHLVARLFGMQPARPDRCRVLEIGAASGGNLIPLAFRYPDSTYVGMDLSRVEVEQGRALVAPLSLPNLDLRHADVLDIDESWGEFDYIIAHGVWSWVPAHVREHMFEVFRRNLAPQGVAYCSYNCLPGWRMRGMIRDAMLFHTAGFEGWKRKVEQARAVLSFLAKVYGDAPTTPYATQMQAEARFLAQLPDEYLYHDYLSDENHAVYFHQFVEQADQHGLSYLGECTLSSMLPQHLPDGVEATLRSIAPDILRMEQYLDFVRNRTFRTTLLVRSEVTLDRSLDWRSMAPYHFGCSGALSLPADLHSDEPAVLEVDGVQYEIAEAVMKAAVALLVDVWPGTVPFDDLLARAAERVGCAPADVAETVGGTLLRGIFGGIVEARVEPSTAVKLSERPEVFSWARILAGTGARRIASLRHDSPVVPEVTALALWYCDGTRTREAIRDAVIDAIERKDIPFQTPDGATLGTADRRRAVDESIDDILASLERNSFLTA